MNYKILQRLAWKDARAIAPFTVAILALIIGFNLLLGFLFWSSDVGTDASERHWLTYSTWMLLPNLFALGVPALLIGSEEESGSLAWLRTLPTDWKSVAGTKFALAMAGYLCSFGLAALGYVAQRGLIPDHLLTSMDRIGSAPDPLWLHALGQVCFGITLLLISFITSFLLRSPVSSLVLVAPLMGGLSLAFTRLTDELIKSGFGSSPWEFAFRHQLASTLGCGMMIFGVLSGVLVWSARRRLSGHERSADLRASSETTLEAFMPPSQPKMIGTWYDEVVRPSPLRVMIWQTLRQNGLMLLVGLVLCAASAIVLGNNSPSPIIGFGFPIGILIIGSMTFYGDGVRRRIAFYHDRGIDPSLIWLSRILPTFVAMLAVLLLIGVFEDELRPRIGAVAAVLFAIYAGIQLTSLWAPRPIMVFFLAPVALVMSGLVLNPLGNSGYGFSWSLWCTAGVLLFASWRMMPRWISNQKGISFHAKFAGYISLAVLLPYVVLLAGQWISLPNEMTQWRQQTLAVKTISGESGKYRIYDGVMRSIWWGEPMELPEDFETSPKDNMTAKIQRELNAKETVAEHVSFRDLLSHMAFYPGPAPVNGYAAFAGYGPDPADQSDNENEIDSFVEKCREHDLQSALVLAKWSRVIREETMRARLDLKYLTRSAEQADAFTLAILLVHFNNYGEDDRLREVYESLPSLDLVLASRRNALIRSWQDVQANGLSEMHPNQLFVGDMQHTNFASHARVPQQWWLWLERKRISRDFDAQVRRTLQRWQPEFTSRESPVDLDAWLGRLSNERSASMLIMGNVELRRELDTRMRR